MAALPEEQEATASQVICHWIHIECWNANEKIHKILTAMLKLRQKPKEYLISFCVNAKTSFVRQAANAFLPACHNQ